MPVEFPTSQISSLHAVATQLIDKRRPRTDLGVLARDLLDGFFEICTRSGLDGVLDQLGELGDREPALVAQLEAIDLDGGGPRNLKAKQLADCVVAALELVPVDEPDRRLVLPAAVRAEVVAAMAQVVDPELAKLKESIIAEAQGRVEAAHRGSFTKMVAQLDDRGQKLLKLPKVPLHAQQAIERALAEARTAVIGRIVSMAFDRVKVVLERADAAAAARLDAPISARATPREVAAIRASDARVPKTAQAVTASLLESLAELAKIGFRAAEKPVHPYAVSKTFAVGDQIEHPKFGRGAVVAVAGQRMEVEFADGKHTLIHGR
jgi:hypothetical protein